MTNHHGQIELGAIQSPGAPAGTQPLTARFVHYPDCQQLMVWLPDYGRSYGRLRIVERAGATTHDGPVTDWLNGSILLLFDTVGMAPGEYMLTVEHPDGWRHQAFTRRLEYEGNYRSGYITYVEGSTRIRLMHEMGGGTCRFFIELPTAAMWEAQTGTPLARRDEIVQWIAEQVQREQAPSWRYEIRADEILFR